MPELDRLLIELIAQLEGSKPNPTLWNSTASKALESQLEVIQQRLRALQHSLIHLGRIAL